MKNCIKFIVVFVVVALGTVQVSSQTVTGKVVDENLAPIAGATIVMQQTDSTFLATTVSKEDGTFSLVRKSIPFILIVQHMAYQTFRQTFGDSHVGVVRLTANVRELDEMGVTARRPYVRAEGGKLVYDVKSLLKNHIADNAWELLDKLPGVSAGGESVTLQGAQKVAVLMDGKVSTLTAEQLQQLLSRTSADRVAKVEVIYNAPPRYHVSGAVINLVMRNPGQGLEGEFMADYQNRYYSGGGVNASMRYATPKATFDLMYGLNNRPHVQHYRLYSLHRLHDERHDIRQEEHIVGKAWAHDLRASFNYRWKEHWDMDFTYTGMFSPDKKSSSRSEGDFQQSLNERGADSRLHNLAWSARLGPGVSLGADYTCFHSDDGQHLSAAFHDGTSVRTVAVGRQVIDRLTLYADRDRPLKNGWNVGYGLAYSYSYDRDSQVYQQNEGMQQAYDTRSKLREQRGEVYGSVSKQFGKGLAMEASLKGEYYRIADYRKWTAYPRFSLSYVPGGKHVFQLTFATDKTYPSFWQMQSSVGYIDGYSEVRQEEGLRPFTDYALNATYVYNRNYIVNLFYSFQDDRFMQLPYQSPERLTLIYQTRNLNYQSHAGVVCVVPVPVAKWLESRLEVGGLYQHVRCDDFFDLSFDRKKWVGFGNLSNSFLVGKDLLFELAARVQSPAIQGNLDLGSIMSVTAGMRWTLAKGRMSCSLYCTDLFNRSLPRCTLDYAGQYMTMDNHFYLRTVSLKLVYRLGGYKQKEVKKVDTSRFGH